MKGVSTMKEYAGKRAIKVLCGILRADLANKSDLNHTHGLATESTPGFMSPDDKRKIEMIIQNGSLYEHPTYTPLTGEPTGAQRPKFGETFQVSQPESNELGHLIHIHSRSVTIPGDIATTTEAGLMPATDKAKLDKIVEPTSTGYVIQKDENGYYIEV